ncbi:golgin subfamily A member 5-like [Anneissia japonica]|uniref:golgin subfamily A member 5-like n=1 Tax=Anneissia japonica TaxID=1529436 RepID=UPI001425B5C0|nr:golgin subfamily A member 5-like [Anneissia japonica]XP_033115974.1 golgin subfamily A member 5-like [Anneissia japonica]
MAWLLGKAEHLLNNLDQSASQALNTSEVKGFTPVKHQTVEDHVSPSPRTFPTSASSVTLSATQLANTANIRRTPSESTIGSFNSQKYKNSPSKSKKEDDEKLFEFLNSPGTGTEKKKVDKKPPNGKHSRQSSTSSNVSSKSGKTEGSSSTGIVITASEQAGNNDDIPDIQEPTPVGTPHSEADASIDIPDAILGSRYQSGQLDEASQRVSTLEYENKLLKNEVSSLNQEMSSALQRAKKSEGELVKIKDELRKKRSQMGESDALIRQLQQREDDLSEELNAKNSQLGVLRVRFQEADSELIEKKKELNLLLSENERILKDHSSSSGVHGKALDSANVKLRESEAALKREQESYQMAQAEFMQRQSKIEEENTSLSESYAAAQKKYNNEKARVNELTTQLRTLKSNLESAKQELTDYKQKATRILQSKDKLINSLKEGAVAIEGHSSSTVELEEMTNERDMLREELHQVNTKLDTLRVEIQDLEMMQQSDAETAQDQIQELQDQLEKERQNVRECEADLEKSKEELKFIQDDSHKQKLNLQAKLQEKDEEVITLKNQLVAKRMSGTTQAELENRLHTLTESLIQKQTMLEALGTEKNSLVLQLERVEKNNKEVQGIHPVTNCNHRHHTVTFNNAEDEEGARQRTLPSFMREEPNDPVVTKNVKRAANTIDKFSIRLGVFLKRYPIARVFVICYMIMLHLWVMIVLLTYSPEIHNDFHPFDNKDPNLHNKLK